MSTVLVLGANGISGIALLEELFKRPSSEYKKIIAISRRPPVLDHSDSRLNFISVDLLGPTETIVEKLKEKGGQDITDIFFFAYIAKDTVEEVIEVNTKLLKNTVDAVQQVSKQVKTFSLQTGTGYYGVAKGGDLMPPLPFKEDSPRHKGKNFYFDLEDLLIDSCAKYGWNYIISRPNFIIGQTRGNFMSIVTTVALYATALKALKKPLIYPGSTAFYNLENDWSTASNNAAFQLYTSKNPKAYNKAFNIADGEPTPWSYFWPKIAEYFNIPVTLPPADEPPADIKMGYDVVTLHSAVDWAKDTDFNAIAKQLNIDPTSFEYATWGFMDFATSLSWKQQMSLDRAREIGWDVSIDTWEEGWKPAFDQLKAHGVIPKA